MWMWRISPTKSFGVFPLAAPVIANAAVFSNSHWQLVWNYRILPMFGWAPACAGSNLLPVDLNARIAFWVFGKLDAAFFVSVVSSWWAISYPCTRAGHTAAPLRSWRCIRLAVP